MFTGLIEEVGLIKKNIIQGEGRVIEISSTVVISDSKIGDSISINGACQTVTGINDNSFKVFVSKITSSLTTLGQLKSGTRVNLERAMLPSSRFGGHIVQGHVDGKGTISSIKKDTHGQEFVINIDSTLRKYIVEKGSIAIDGISLTVVTITDNGFSIYLIPETIGNTIINDWSIGADVNIETDILAKYIENIINNSRNKKSDNADNNEGLKNKLYMEGFL